MRLTRVNPRPELSQSRFALLKYLIACIDPRGASASTDLLARHIHTRLFRETLNGRVAWKALLESEGVSSPRLWLSPKECDKVVDFGRKMGVIKAGNQITEKGQVLRRIIEADEHQANYLLNKRPADVQCGNPFVLCDKERWFFFFCALDSDNTWLFVLDEFARHLCVKLAGVADGLPCTEDVRNRQLIVSVRDASKLVYKSVYRLYSALEAERGWVETEARRTLRPVWHWKLTKPGVREPDFERLQRSNDPATRVRLEQMADLGFVSRGQGETAERQENGKGAPSKAPTGRYRMNQSLIRFREILGNALGFSDPNSPISFDTVDCKVLLWQHFARLSQAITGPPSRDVAADALLLARLVKNSYERVKRAYGHTSVYSIALLAMIEGGATGYPVEMSDIHKFLSQMRADRSRPPGSPEGNSLEKAFNFSGGADLDWMFVTIDVAKLEELFKVEGRITPA